MPLDTMCPQTTPSTGTLQRIDILSAHGWQAKLYAPAMEAAGLRPEDLAVAERAFRASVAEPSTARIAGFALLRLGDEPGSLVLSAFWWEGAILHRAARMLPGCGSPPRRPSDAAERIGDMDEIVLMAREAAAWRRCVLDANVPSIDAYLVECCA